MKKLTEKQEKVLGYVVDFIEENGFSPTYRDVADCFDISVKGAYDHIVALRKKQKIIVYGPQKHIWVPDKPQIQPTDKSIRNAGKRQNAYRLMGNMPKANTCSLCGGKINVERHHEDYDKPAEVIELCRVHHRLWHRYKTVFRKANIKIT